MSHSRRPLLIAVAASLLGLALRVGVAEKQVLWVDEVFSLAMATGHSMEQPASVSRPAPGRLRGASPPGDASDLPRLRGA